MNMGIFYAILIFVGVCVGIDLAWFLIELVITLRKTRKKIDEVHKQVTPTIENIEAITTKIQPAIEKVDPLIERVSLTIDAANLELMRADQIMENINVVAEGAANTTTAIGNIASAPAELLNKAGQKIAGLFGASDTKALMGEAMDGENIQQIVQQAKKQGRKFGRRVNKRPNQIPVNQMPQGYMGQAGVPAQGAVPVINQKQQMQQQPAFNNMGMAPNNMGANMGYQNSMAGTPVNGDPFDNAPVNNIGQAPVQDGEPAPNPYISLNS